jgi:hypothetical protein
LISELGTPPFTTAGFARMSARFIDLDRVGASATTKPADLI